MYYVGLLTIELIDKGDLIYVVLIAEPPKPLISQGNIALENKIQWGALGFQSEFVHSLGAFLQGRLLCFKGSW